METQETICQKAKRLLEPIPADLWVIGQYYDSDEPTKGCALGHFNGRVQGSSLPRNHSDEEMKLRDATKAYIKSIGITCNSPFGYDIATINNSPRIGSYNQETSKERVMALLDDCIAAGL